MPDTPERTSPPEEAGTTLGSLIQRAFPVTVRGGISAVIAISGGLAVSLGFIIFLFIQELRGSAYTVMAIGGILLLASLMISFATVRESITGRRGLYSTNTVVMVTAFVALAVLVFIVAERNAYRWDVTATRQFTLAPQTLEILRNLAEPALATAFFVDGIAQHERFRVPVGNLLNEFQHRSSNKFSYRFVNPDIQPSLANHYNVTQFPAVVFEGEESGFQYRVAAPLFEERDFASGLLIVTGEKRKRIYYLDGHGERDFQDRASSSHQGFGSAADGLFRDNYDVVPFSLYAEEEPHIPVAGENAVAAVIIAGPKQELIPKEIQAIDDYLRLGGRLLLLLEPDPPQTYLDLLARWAVTMESGFVIDVINNVAGETQTPLIKRDQYSDTPPIDSITASLDQSYFPVTASFLPIMPIEELPDTLRLYPVAQTTLVSCLTTDPEVTQCPLGDFAPRVPVIAVQAFAPLNEEPDPNAPQETKIVVFGDTDFATNFYFYSLSNSDLLLNSVNWLTEDINLASVRSKPITFRNLVVTGREMQLIRALVWFVLPATMALLAVVAWWRRR